MVSPRVSSLYPVEYKELFKKAMLGPIEIHLASDLQARRFRNQLYAFRDTLFDNMHDVDPITLIIAPLAKMRIIGSTLIISYPATNQLRSPGGGLNAEHNDRY